MITERSNERRPVLQYAPAILPARVTRWDTTANGARLIFPPPSFWRVAIGPCVSTLFQSLLLATVIFGSARSMRSRTAVELAIPLMLLGVVLAIVWGTTIPSLVRVLKCGRRPTTITVLAGRLSIESFGYTREFDVSNVVDLRLDERSRWPILTRQVRLWVVRIGDDIEEAYFPWRGHDALAEIEARLRSVVAGLAPTCEPRP
jgi:hypothetical protein